jgi:hypothetical protein
MKGRKNIFNSEQHVRSVLSRLSRIDLHRFLLLNKVWLKKRRVFFIGINGRG